MNLQEIAECYLQSLQKQEIPSFFPRVGSIQKGTIIQFNRGDKTGMGVVSETLGEDIKLMWLSEQTWLASEKDYFLEEEDSPLRLPLICCTWLVLCVKEDDIISNFGVIESLVMRKIKLFSSNTKLSSRSVRSYLHIFVLGDEPLTYPLNLLVREIEDEGELVLVQSGPLILSKDDPRSWVQEQLREYFSVFVV